MEDERGRKREEVGRGEQVKKRGLLSEKKRERRGEETGGGE